MIPRRLALRLQRRPAPWTGNGPIGCGPAAMQLSPEFRLVCLALRQPRRAEDLAALRKMLAVGPQWSEVIEGARRHRLAPLLLRGIHPSLSPFVPQPVLAELRR